DLAQARSPRDPTGLRSCRAHLADRAGPPSPSRWTLASASPRDYRSRMARWLIALAVVVVSRPVGATPDGGFRLEEVHHKITTSTSVVAPSGVEPSLASVAVGDHLLAVERPGLLDIVDTRTGNTIASTR